MKKLSHALCISGLVGVLALLLPLAAWEQAPTPADRKVSIDPRDAILVPEWEGWGCSLSWWGVYSKNWKPERRRELCRLLFSTDPDALGWNICRYNAGGTSPEADAARYRPGADVRVVLDSDGAWHPERDMAQISCLKDAIHFGANRLELFVNSPPYWMLKNGNTLGGDSGKENLKPEFQSAYARWLADVLASFQTREHISFNFVAPFNEPSAWWWKPDSSNQEGSKIDWPTQANVMRVLGKALSDRKLNVGISASDENGAEQGYNTLKWLTAPVHNGGGITGALLHKLNVHAYNGANWQMRLRNLAAGQQIPVVWMSEVTYREAKPEGFVPNDMRCALPITRSIVNDIRNLHCSAWVYWQPIEPLQQDLKYNYTYGLIPTSLDTAVNFNGKTYQPGEGLFAKSYYAVRQFSAFIRPGDRLLASGDDSTLAAYSAKDRRLTIVVQNDSTETRPYDFDFATIVGQAHAVKVWRTANDTSAELNNCRALPPIPISGTRFSDSIPPQSVTTYVLISEGT